MPDEIKPRREKDCGVPDCGDQLPVISTVGRGMKGDDFIVEIFRDDTDETYLIGKWHDNATDTLVDLWTSENINGGELSYQYNLRPYTVPQTFTITFIYRRPNRPEWSWTTPVIPYLWDANGDGKPDTDGIVGTGVGALYIREAADKPWISKLILPPGTGPSDYNMPAPQAVWSVNLTFGVGGDIEIPNLRDLSKILGVPEENLKNIVNGQTGQFGGSNNVKAYVDDKDAAMKTYVDGKVTELYTAIDNSINNLRTELTQQITNVSNQLGTEKTRVDRLNLLLRDLLVHIYNVTPGPSSGDVTNINWGNDDLMARGNMNIFSGASSENYIRTRSAVTTNDLRAL